MFHSQKNKAKRRGIGWELTYEQWRHWWGDDLAKRGQGKDDLQMQRPADSGPYALWNIRKGRPVENVKTAGAIRRNKAAEKARAEREAVIDALMWAPSRPDDDERQDEHLHNLGWSSTRQMKYTYRA